LIVASSTREIPIRRFEGLVEHIDLFPTILDLAETDGPPSEVCRRAQSLAPFLRGNEMAAKKLAFSERRTFDLNRHEQLKQRLIAQSVEIPSILGSAGLSDEKEAFFTRLMVRQLMENYEPGESTAVLMGALKLIRRTQAPDEFFDLKTDPREARDLAGTGGRDAINLEEAARLHLEWTSRTARRDSRQVEPDTHKLLEALGYLN
jgi:arylsulfatase A-like enzyme